MSDVSLSLHAGEETGELSEKTTGEISEDGTDLTVVYSHNTTAFKLSHMANTSFYLHTSQECHTFTHEYENMRYRN